MSRMPVGTLLIATPLAVLPLAYGCGGNSDTTGTAGDASPGDVGVEEGHDASNTGDAGNIGDASNGNDTGNPQPEAGMDAGCAHTGDPLILKEALDAGGDAGFPRPIYSSSALTIFDVGRLDIPVGLTSDGSTALVEDGPTGDLYFYDTTSQMLTRKANVAGNYMFNGATAIGGNGGRASAWYAQQVGDASTSIVGAVWDQCAGWMFPDQSNPAGCPDMPAFVSAVNDVNEDGTIAVGYVSSSCNTGKAMQWTYANGTWTPTALPKLSANDEAWKVSGNGKLIGGSVPAPANSSPAVWFNGKGVMLDPSLSPDNAAKLLAVSADGTMVAGYWNAANDAGGQTNNGFYWTTSDQTVHLIPVLPSAGSDDGVWIYAIAHQNQLLLGQMGGWQWPNSGPPTDSEPQAAYWTPSGGLHALQDAVSAQGMSLPSGLSFYDVQSASDDGTVLFGTVIDNNALSVQAVLHNFVLRMPVSAYGL